MLILSPRLIITLINWKVYVIGVWIKLNWKKPNSLKKKEEKNPI